MSKRMAFSKTIPQMRGRTKTVTRRFGWWDGDTDEPRVQPGDIVLAIEKGMGLAKGERQKVLHPIEIISIRREPLGIIDAADILREGFPGMSPDEFFRVLGGKPSDVVTRIEFRHLDTPEARCSDQ